MNWSTQPNKTKTGLTTLELTKFALFGGIMFASKILMEWAPNIHLLGMFTMVFTLVYRKKALVILYVFVFLTGLFGGFSLWWFPHLYLWTILWGVTMLLPRHMPHWLCAIVYPIVCMLHGFCYGILYAPAQALMFGLNFEGMIAWIISGIPFDIAHGIGNLFAGLLILPLFQLLHRLEHEMIL